MRERITTEAILQNVRELRVSERNMLEGRRMRTPLVQRDTPGRCMLLHIAEGYWHVGTGIVHDLME